MARESRVNGSQHFDRIKEIVLNRVERNRTVTLAQLKRILCLHFGRTYFRRRKYVDLLTHVIEYLLYTRKVIVVNPDGLNAETVYGAVSYTTAVFSEYLYPCASNLPRYTTTITTTTFCGT
jgi:hypothetical protein